MSLTMYDSVTVATVPDNPQAVAGYIDGLYRNYDEMVAKFPRAHHLSIAVRASAGADCLDCEPGDASPSEVAAWVKSEHARGITRPAVYASLSASRGILDLLSAAGIARSAVRIWTAHYTNVPHLCGPHCGFNFNTTADATQYTDTALGRNLDASLVQDSFFGPPPPPPDPHHYQYYPSKPFLVFGVKLSERSMVQLYDKWRAKQTPTKHPYRPQLVVLRVHLRYLAGRVYKVAHQQPVNGKPSWDRDHRGFRYQGLIHRAEGKKVV